MASNKFFTIMVVPEKTQQVRKIVIPHYVFNGAILALVVFVVLATIMILDYANVMNQISENKQLKVENRQLHQSIQVFKNKLISTENTLDRVKTFVTKLRIITNLDSRASPLTMPNPPAATDQSSKIDREPAEIPPPLNQSKRRTLLAALTPTSDSGSGFTMNDAGEQVIINAEFEKLDAAYDEVNRFALEQEQQTHDLLESLSEKRTQLASMPTLIPTLGYITSDYGVRISPYDNRRKMHEGIDIANRFGSDIIAPGNGVITFAGVKTGYGKTVVIDHGNGIETHFAHCSKIFVASGDRIKRGDRIGAVGNSGHSTGPHCHYEVHARGLPVDPCWYIVDHPALCKENASR